MLTLGVAIPLVGCASSAPTTDSPALAAEVAGAAARPTPAKPGSLADAIVGLALELPGLPADQQRTVEGVRADLSAATDGVRVARVAFARAVAAQVLAGKVDRGALSPAIEALHAAGDAALPARQRALAELHGALDVGQRRALVEIGRARLGSASERRAELRERLAQVADDLELSDAQRAAVEDRVKAGFLRHLDEHRVLRVELEARLEALSDAFVSNDFDPAKVGATDAAHRVTARMIDGVLALVEATLPELDSAQRERLAGHLVARAE